MMHCLLILLLECQPKGSLVCVCVTPVLSLVMCAYKHTQSDRPSSMGSYLQVHVNFFTRDNTRENGNRLESKEMPRSGKGREEKRRGRKQVQVPVKVQERKRKLLSSHKRVQPTSKCHKVNCRETRNSTNRIESKGKSMTDIFDFL